jgi:hypothetical protein
MIKLEDFVSETIKEIINGVVTPQEFAATKGASVNPVGLNLGETARWGRQCGKCTCKLL